MNGFKLISMGEITTGNSNLGPHDLLQLAAEAGWNASREDRGTKFHNRGTCYTREAPYGPQDPHGRGLHEVCRGAGCLDLLHELVAAILLKLMAKLDGGTVADPGAYAYRVARTALVELSRSARTAAGYPAKPGRDDGVPARVNVALLDAAGHRGPWLVVLFRILRAYPFSPNHVAGRWPIDGLLQEREKHFPDEGSTTSMVRREVAMVIQVAKQVAGQDWVYSNLTLPLLSNGGGQTLPENLCRPEDDHIEQLLAAMFKDAYLRLRRCGHVALDAYRVATVEVTGRPAPKPTPQILTALRELEDEVSSRGYLLAIA
ncbi:hypothetical protein FOJ82_13485 [Tessaracoccus rhinocerotis]|uniref:Uncharacterized protein n=1 Tax=Tessaracoccus rhinocerotis TaxID=1689449 RepID=A0A553JWS7_9ACTN|nr:hypothetical protein [Tessaracoccus rhinocerotis]TRY16880.1 hypothetical protein FOJ82_13485 [Tessaracoccus rhinocerotis]